MFPVCKENKADKVYGNVELEDVSDNLGISVYLPMATSNHSPPMGRGSSLFRQRGVGQGYRYSQILGRIGMDSVSFS